MAGEELVRAHAAGLAPAAGARADDEFVFAPRDRRDEIGHQLRAVAAVAVEKYDDVAIAGRLDAGMASPAITAPALADDAGPGRARPLDRAVGAAAVGNYDFVGAPQRDCRQDGRDGFLFVEGRDHHCDPRPGCWSLGRRSLWRCRPGHRLQRRPQPAQAGGGLSLSSAARKCWYRSPFQISRRLSCVASPRVKLS